MTIRIFHNPRCSKSRETLKLIREQGHEPEVVEYLVNPPSERELDDILDLLGMEPDELMRRKEAPYRELQLDRRGLTRSALIKAMVENPILIERPIVLAGNKAALGRPPEAVLEILPKAKNKK